MEVSDLKSKDQIAERVDRFVVDAAGTGRSLYALGAIIHIAIIRNLVGRCPTPSGRVDFKSLRVIAGIGR